jgi:hypothetical protein
MTMDTQSSPQCTILLVSGSLRGGSVNSAVLRTARALTTPPTAATIYERLGDLPHFNPDDDRPPLPEAVAHLRAQLNDRARLGNGASLVLNVALGVGASRKGPAPSFDAPP